MKTKFYHDVVSVSDLKINPDKIVKRTKESRRPILLTSRGRGVAVLQGLEEYEKCEEELEFTRAVVQGLVEIKDGKEQSLENVKEKLGFGEVNDY